MYVHIFLYFVYFFRCFCQQGGVISCTEADLAFLPHLFPETAMETHTLDLRGNYFQGVPKDLLQQFPKLKMLLINDQRVIFDCYSVSSLSDTLVIMSDCPDTTDFPIRIPFIWWPENGQPRQPVQPDEEEPPELTTGMPTTVVTFETTTEQTISTTPSSGLREFAKIGVVSGLLSLILMVIVFGFMSYYSLRKRFCKPKKKRTSPPVSLTNIQDPEVSSTSEVDIYVQPVKRVVKQETRI